MANRRPAGFAPTASPKTTTPKNFPAASAEDEEFEKFLNEVAEGEQRLKQREDEERQRDWEETQQYLKRQKDARLAAQATQQVPQLPTPLHLPPPSVSTTATEGHPGQSWNAQPKMRTSPRGEPPPPAQTSPAVSPRSMATQLTSPAILQVPSVARLSPAGNARPASPLLSACRQRADGSNSGPHSVSPRSAQAARLATPTAAELGLVSPGRTRVEPRAPPLPVQPASVPASLSPRSATVSASATSPTAASPLASHITPDLSLLPPLTSYDIARVVRIQALVRRFLCYTAFKRRRENREKHRIHVARELLETERQYVRALDSVTQSYYERLMFNCKVCSSSASADKPILELDKLQAIFGNLPEIRNFNSNFLQELTARCEHFDNNTKLGDLFLKWGPFFKIYITYCNNHDRAAHLFLELREEARFGSWLENTRTLMQVDPLDSYLIRPVQRIPRYLLLLNDLLKSTKPDHCDYADLKNGISQMQSLADQINAAIKQAEKLNQVLRIQERLGVKDLVEPSRVYVRTGVLQLCQLDNSSMFKKDVTNYWFFLFNDLLVWAERTGDSYRYRGRVSLVGMRLKDIVDVTVVQNAFHLISSDRTLIVSAPTKKEKTVWMDHIQESISRLKDLQKRLGTDLTPAVPFVSAAIICNETRKDKEGKPYTVYVIEVKRSKGNVEWIERRYSEFDALHGLIEKRFPNQNFTKLPKKHLLGNLKKDIVQSRQIMLETYLQELIAKPDVCRCEELERFLTTNAEKKSTLPVVKVFYRHDADISWTVAVTAGTRTADVLRHVARKLGCEMASLSLIEVWHNGERRLELEESIQMLKNKWELQNLPNKLYISRSDHSSTASPLSRSPTRSELQDSSSTSLTSSSSSLSSSFSVLPLLDVPVPSAARELVARTDSPSNQSVFENFQSRPLPMSPLRSHLLDERPRTPSGSVKPLPPLPARAGSRGRLLSAEPTDASVGSAVPAAPALARLSPAVSSPALLTRAVSPPARPLSPPSTVSAGGVPKVSPRPMVPLKKPANVREW